MIPRRLRIAQRLGFPIYDEWQGYYMVRTWPRWARPLWGLATRWFCMFCLCWAPSSKREWRGLCVDCYLVLDK